MLANMRKCSVPCCRSNFKKNKKEILIMGDCIAKYITTFSFPKDDILLKKWIKAINRKDFTPNKHSAVCVKHFDSKFVILEDSHTRPDGTILTVKRGIPALVEGAYPTIFAGQPSYLTTKLPKERTALKTREENLETLNNFNLDLFFKQDEICSYDNFLKNIAEKIKSKWTYKSFDSYTVVFNFVDEIDIPKIKTAIKVNSNLIIENIWHNELCIPVSKFKHLLGKEGKLNSWSKFDNILSNLNSYSTTLTKKNKIAKSISLLSEILEDDNETDNKIWFVVESLKQVLLERPSYSSDYLMWACKIYFYSPVCYKVLRDTNVLTLPHPSYIKKICQLNFDSSENFHTEYLGKIIKTFQPGEIYVSLLLDEIYVNKTVTYKGGSLHGMAIDSDKIASTMQAFMITSIISAQKHVVALFPMNNLNTIKLVDLIKKVLKMLHDVGFVVVTVISDNNRVNRNAFEAFCGGRLETSIPNPHRENERIFFLFDTVHILKSIRNNFLNQKNPIQTFMVPNDNSEIIKVSLKPLKDLYHEEKTSVIKFAPMLSEKVLYPTNMERQNVQYAVRLFDEKNIAALKMKNIEGNEELSSFLSRILSWWRIVNVKHPNKGARLRLDQCQPIKNISSLDNNLIFLKEFCNWLNEWESLKTGKTREGKLSRETFFSLYHSTLTLMHLSDYLMKKLSLKYVLLGKFQTDHLEERFGMYRRLSGTNYHISVIEIFESEKKIKILNALKLSTSNLPILDLHVNESISTVKECDIGEELVRRSLDSIEECIKEEDTAILIYIAGYIVKSLKNKFKCNACIDRLELNKELNIELNLKDSKYLNILDRG